MIDGKPDEDGGSEIAHTTNKVILSEEMSRTTEDCSLI